MAGQKPNVRRRVGPFDGAIQVGRDECDIAITVDLMGVRREISKDIVPGMKLRVALIREGDFTAVACMTHDGHIVGTLAAFPGLVRLVNCLANDVRYSAFVEDASITRCIVTVERIP